MTSKKKIAANRANAQKSTGPKTQAGKDVSRRNSLVHGLTAEVLLLDHEDPAQFEALRDAIHEEYVPPALRDAVHLEMADQLTMNLWRMRRIPVLERALVAWVAHRMHVTHDEPSGEMPGPKPAKGIAALVPAGLSLTKAPQGGGDLQRLKIGRALEALLESNALGKLDAHHARLSNDCKYLINWLELQKRGQVGYQPDRTALGTRIVYPEAEDIPPRIVPPSAQSATAAPTAGAGSPHAPPVSSSWNAASARGGYISPTEREARKQEAQPKGGSANTAG